MQHEGEDIWLFNALLFLPVLELCKSWLNTPIVHLFYLAHQMHPWDVISGRCLHLWNIIFKKQRGDIGDWKPSVASIVQCFGFFPQAIVDFYLDWIVNGVSTPPRGEENVFKCRQAFNLLSLSWTHQNTILLKKWHIDNLLHYIDLIQFYFT